MKQAISGTQEGFDLEKGDSKTIEQCEWTGVME